MENEELFKFMEKIYNELQSTKTEMREGFTKLKADIKKNADAISALKDELKETKKTLFDGYNQNYEMISEIKKLVEKNSEDIQEINILMNEMKEDINFIASKTIRNDSKINKITEKLKAVK